MRLLRLALVTPRRARLMEARSSIARHDCWTAPDSAGRAAAMLSSTTTIELGIDIGALRAEPPGLLRRPGHVLCRQLEGRHARGAIQLRQKWSRGQVLAAFRLLRFTQPAKPPPTSRHPLFRGSVPARHVTALTPQDRA